MNRQQNHNTINYSYCKSIFPAEVFKSSTKYLGDLPLMIVTTTNWSKKLATFPTTGIKSKPLITTNRMAFDGSR